MFTATNLPFEGNRRYYRSGKLKIAKSSNHTDMFIIEHPDGKFHNVSANADQILRRYPCTPLEPKTRGALRDKFSRNN